MKSSTGKYFLGLDQIRGLAACLVFSWHFLHGGRFSTPVPLSVTPSVFPLALFDEGHTGVALFMTLSGYLFAKLLDGRRISFGAFLWNRFIRLAPLLCLVILAAGWRTQYLGGNVQVYWQNVARGFYGPGFPNGGWSVTVEAHFYLLLPLLLLVLRRAPWALTAVVGVALVLRTLIFLGNAGLQYLSYHTLIGRMDQFVFGILAFHFRRHITGRHFVAMGVLVAFSAFYYWFDYIGGYYRTAPFQKFPAALWIVLPTIEGFSYALLIAWYDNSLTPPQNLFGRVLASVGSYSYSIYLLHFFVVFKMSRFALQHIPMMKNFYVALPASWLALLCLWPVGYLSFRYIEAPFLRLRRKYIVDD